MKKEIRRFVASWGIRKIHLRILYYARFRLESNKEGTRWFGKCWYVHELLKYEFDVEFDIPVTFPMTAPEIALPELDGKTAKMYRGGKICLSDHFKPLWGRDGNSPIHCLTS